MRTITKIGEVSRARYVDALLKDGDDVATVRLRVLSAAERDEIDRLYPEPALVRAQDSEGKWYVDQTAPEYANPLINDVIPARKHAMVCGMLGDEFFGTDNLAEQRKVLLDTFTRDQIDSLWRQGNKSTEITAEDLARAKDKLVPFVNAPQAEAAT